MWIAQLWFSALISDHNDSTSDNGSYALLTVYWSGFDSWEIPILIIKINLTTFKPASVVSPLGQMVLLKSYIKSDTQLRQQLPNKKLIFSFYNKYK